MNHSWPAGAANYPYMQSGGPGRLGVNHLHLRTVLKRVKLRSIHRLFPLPMDVDNIQEVEDDILDCIRVAHPTLQQSQSELRTQFIYPATETVEEDPVSEIEDGILATYLPNEADEPEADIPLTIPPPVTLHEALAYMEGLLLFSLQAEPTANINELQEFLKREQKRIETLEIRRRSSTSSAGLLTF